LIHRSIWAWIRPAAVHSPCKEIPPRLVAIPHRQRFLYPVEHGQRECRRRARDDLHQVPAAAPDMTDAALMQGFRKLVSIADSCRSSFRTIWGRSHTSRICSIRPKTRSSPLWSASFSAAITSGGVCAGDGRVDRRSETGICGDGTRVLGWRRHGWNLTTAKTATSNALAVSAA
jgi:hypothetical protein